LAIGHALYFDLFAVEIESQARLLRLGFVFDLHIIVRQLLYQMDPFPSLLVDKASEQSVVSVHRIVSSVHDGQVSIRRRAGDAP
jgi:hypothetical protein